MWAVLATVSIHSQAACSTCPACWLASPGGQKFSNPVGCRCEPFSSACEAGIVYVLQRPWTEDFLDEVCNFPRATHDDQVIAAAGAFNDLVVTVGEVITVGLNLGG